MQSYHLISRGTLPNKRRRRYAGNVKYSKELRSHWRSLGGGAEVAMAQPHHPLANQWFNSHEGFSKAIQDRGKWGLYHRRGGLTTIPPAPPTSWNESTPGMYYVDNTHPLASDTSQGGGYNNGYPGIAGDPNNPGRPRVTLPFSLPGGHTVPAGAFIDVRGGPYAYAVGTAIPVGGTGNSVEPILVTGKNGANGLPVVLNTHLYPKGSYMVIEGFRVADWPPDKSGGVIGGPEGHHHIVIRDCEFTKQETGVANRPDNWSGMGIYSNLESQPTNNIIVANCKFHDLGDWQWNPAPPSEDHPDRHGIGVQEFANDITIMNCEFYNCEGNGIQVNSRSNLQVETTRDVFIYRNKMHHNKQAGAWVRFASRVTCCQNEVYSQAGSNSEPEGAAFGCQYGWHTYKIVDNNIHNCKSGVVIAGFDPGGANGTGLVIQENDFFEIDAPACGTLADFGFGVLFYDRGAILPSVFANTFNTCKSGVGVRVAADVFPVTIGDNDFEGMTCTEIHFENCASPHASSICNNTADTPDGRARIQVNEQPCPPIPWCGP